MENKKLYKVTLRGMTTNSTGTKYGVSYVISTGLDEAYFKVRRYLDDNKIGFVGERELDKIELIAEGNQYSGTGHILYI